MKEEKEEEEEFSCGWGRWRPGFLRNLATLKNFTIVYGLLGTVQAMSFVYFIATLTTLEKRFQIRSEITGILMSGNEISQISLAIFLAYKGGKGNRPVWIAWGVLFSSVSCFILAIPHFVYGPGSKALALTEEHLDFQSTDFPSTVAAATAADDSPVLCRRRNSTGIDRAEEDCRERNGEKPLLSLFLIFFSQFVLGVGTTLYVTLGQPYLDDNTRRKNTPKLLGMTMALRSAGPAGGFVLGFLCLNSYIDPSLTPVIERSDPRWLGAWWLGWIILGSIMTIFSFLIASFPRRLKKKKSAAGNVSKSSDCFYESVPTSGRSEPEEKKTELELNSLGDPSNSIEDREGFLSGFNKALKRVFTNPLLIFNNLAAVFYVLGASGYINFYAKYAEVQYHQSAAFSSMIGGVSTVASIVFGFLLSGFAISKFKPKESRLLLFNVFIAAVYMAGEIGFLFMDCGGSDFVQGDTIDEELENSWCNANCSCHLAPYSPVCYEKGNQSFSSPCHAGCSQVEDVAKKTYTNCSCLPEPTDVVRQGPCKVNCLSVFAAFLAVQCLIQLIGCSGRITNVLINYRAVEPRDKPLAQGVCLFMISLLAFIPGPIIYGKVIDGTCIIWDGKCGYKGNCWVYDKDEFRKYLNATALCFTFGAFLCDIIVFYLGRNIKLYEEDSDGEKT